MEAYLRTLQSQILLTFSLTVVMFFARLIPSLKPVLMAESDVDLEKFLMAGVDLLVLHIHVNRVDDTVY